MQKKFVSKIVQISEIVEWYNKGEINYSPKYQRNSVWNLNAKSYLIDSIVRGMPIPPIFIRQRVDVSTKKINREVVDGQQRVRAIVEYVSDEKFSIFKKHNTDIGGLKYSELDDDLKKEILEYEIIAQVINESSDTIVYDMFSRFNTNSVVLNSQELRNAKYWGDFKSLIYSLSSKYREFFYENKLCNDKELSRMKDSELVNSLVILILKGIVSEKPSYVDSVYTEKDTNFDEMDSVRDTFDNTMSLIQNVFDKFERKTIFSNKNYFYTLFAIAINPSQYELSQDELILNINQFLSNQENALSKDSSMTLEDRKKYQDLDVLHRKQTTDKTKRIERVIQLAKLIREGA